MRVKFTEVYQHRWPSRAVSRYRPDGGPHGDGVYSNVKPEVVAAAIAAGKATTVPGRAKKPVDGQDADSGQRGLLAEPDPAGDVGPGVFDPVVDGPGQ